MPGIMKNKKAIIVKRMRNHGMLALPTKVAVLSDWLWQRQFPFEKN